MVQFQILLRLVEIWGQGFALRGEFLSGCPERNQRGTRARLKMSALRSYSPPLDPVFTGAKLGGVID